MVDDTRPGRHTHAQHDAGVPAHDRGDPAARGQVHGDGQVVTATADSPARESYADLGRGPPGSPTRCARWALRRPAGRHLPVEQRRAPRGLPRRPVDGRGAAHPEHPAVPRAADLHRQPRRGQGRHRRRLAGRPAGQAAADLETVEHVVVAGPDATAAASTRCGRPASRCTLYEELLRAAGRPSTGPISTSATRRRCATPPARRATRRASSTATARRTCTRWRSAWDRCGLTWPDRVLPIVPMFHANAWGLPYAALMTGASLVMPDRWLQAEPLCRFMREVRPTVSRAVPTVWNDVLGHLDAARGSTSPPTCAWCSAAARGAGVAAEGARGAARHPHRAGLGDDRDVARRVGGPAAAGVEGDDEWHYRGGQGRLLPGVEGRIVGDDGTEMPWDGEAVGELEVRGAVGDRRPTTSTTTRRSSATAGCAPATSASSTRSATSRSPTGPRTSSSPAASGSPRSTSRTR